MLRRIRSLVSNSNYIERYNSLSKDDCDRLINYFEKSSITQGPVYRKGGNEIDFSVKKCKQLRDVPSFNNKDIVYNIVWPHLVSCLQKYTKKYPSLDWVPKWNIFDEYAFQKYEDESDGFKLWHIEHGPGGVSPNRLLAWMFYLNNAKSGTEFMHFPTVHAKMGECVIWPATWPYLHKGVIPNKGLKYIITGWVSYT